MPGSKLRKDLLSLALGLAAALPAWAVNVFVTSVAPSQVQLIVDASVVRTLRIGETSPEGVRLVAIQAGAAVLEVGGKPVTLGPGQATVLETTLRADAKGHFVVNALINGVPVAAIIDTGATNVSMSMNHAARLGIDLRGAQRIVSQTANGRAYGYLVPLASVQVGDIVLRNVAGEVVEGGLDALPIVLIGMSFLRHVEMRRSGSTMTLSRPHL